MRPSLSKSKNLSPMLPHGVFRKILFGLVDESLASCVLEVVGAPLHVENGQARKTSRVQISKACISTPAGWPQAHAFSHVLEPGRADILVQDGILIPLGMQMTRESVRQPHRTDPGRPYRRWCTCRRCRRAGRASHRCRSQRNTDPEEWLTRNRGRHPS